MASKNISRLTAYITGQTINADEHNAEHQQYVDNFNELFKSFDYDGTFHYLLSDKTKFTFSNLNLEQILSSSHNADGTVKADKVVGDSWLVADLKSFLDISHNPDGTIKSDGIADPLIYAHNNDINAHPEIKRIEVVSPPIVIADSLVAIGYSYNYTFKANPFLDENDVSIATFEIDWGDGTVESVNATNNSATVSHTYNGNDGDIYTITVYAVDTAGNKSKTSTFSVTLTADNPPSIDSVVWSSNVLLDNKTYTVTINASDLDNDPLTYSLTASDPNVSITQDSTNPNVFTVTFPDYTADTSVDFTYEASDGTLTTRLTETKTVLDFNQMIAVVDAGNSEYLYNSFVDSQGNLYVVGANYDGTYYNAYIAKYDRNLNLLDQYQFNLGNNSRFFGIYIDSNDNVYVCGDYNNGTNYIGWLIQFDTSLNIIAQKVLDIGSDINLYNVKVDNQGNIYACGSYNNGTDNNFYIVKFDSNLNVLSQITIDSGAGRDYLFCIDIDSQGNVYGCGWDGVPDFYIVKFDSNLNVLVQITINSGLNDYLFEIKVDSNDNVFAVGRIYDSTNALYDSYIVKLDSSLNILAQKVIDSGTNDDLIGVNIDSNDNIYIFGNFDNGTNRDFYIAKFDNNLNPISQKAIDGGNDDYPWFFNSPVLYKDAILFVTGYTSNGTNNDHFVAELEAELPTGTYATTTLTFTYTDVSPTITDATYTATTQTYAATAQTWAWGNGTNTPTVVTYTATVDTLG